MARPILKQLAAASVLLLAQMGNASALSLVEAYDAALANDQVYRAAYYAGQAGQENRAIARAGLLPNLSGSYSAYKNRADILRGGKLEDREYRSSSGNVSLRQTLFNLEAYARYRQGDAQTRASEAQFEFERQKLILRVLGAYMDALFTDEQEALVVAQRDMYKEQKALNERLFQRGEGTRTDMLETTARLDLAEARLLEARDAQLAARTTLAAMIGQEVTTLDRLDSAFQPAPFTDGSFEQWKQEALVRNPEIKAHVLSAEVARLEVLKARAGHAPRLDFVASYSKNDSETINTLDQESKVKSVGIQLNIPFYSGGSVQASSRQAVANRERALAEVEARKNDLVLQMRKDYDAVVSSVAKIAALRKAVDSAELLKKATERSIQGGVRINLDLLNAQEQLFTAQRDLSQARFGYLTGLIRLRAGSGALTLADVREIAAHFRK